MPQPDLLTLTPASRLVTGPGPWPAPTLMLVEDSRHAAEAVRLIARRLGMRLRRADTLVAARRHLRVYRPDVALVDLGLPDGSGLDLIAELAMARPRLRRVVALSADPDAGAAALAAGADGFVAKPLRLPADLVVLLGPGAPTLADWTAPPEAEGRNGGADPLALRDDLMTAQAALTQGDAQGLAWALQFVGGVARCVGDAGLVQAVAQARVSGQSCALAAALDARAVGAGPM